MILGSKEKIKITKLAYCWCLIHLKRSKYHSDAPKIIIKTQKNEKFKGYFNYKKNIFCIFVKNHKIQDDICQTIIHEWKHYQQNLKMYDRYIILYGRNFKNHPYEKIAENFAIKNFKKCTEWINSKKILSNKKIKDLCIKSI
jgi:hypothetical protein